jgi:hypothetical protein
MKRRGRELHQSAQARENTDANLQNPPASPPRRVRLHRNVLQPKAQACEEQDAVARRVRTPADIENRGRLENSGLFTRDGVWGE